MRLINVRLRIIKLLGDRRCLIIYLYYPEKGINSTAISWPTSELTGIKTVTFFGTLLMGNTSTMQIGGLASN